MRTDNRWWEFYAVRYAMGTVVGAIIIYFVCESTGVLEPLLLMPSDTQQVNAANLIIFAAFGLTFCYIASAPILVFHVARFDFVDEKSSSFYKIIFNSFVRILIYVAVTLIAAYWMPPSNSTNTVILNDLAVFVVATVFLLQAELVVRTLYYKDRMYDFYKSLSRSRTKDGNGDIVESYKHLREHGNSFAIVFFEITLGSIFYVVGNAGTGLSRSFGPPSNLVAGYALIILLWIIPAAFVWGIGTKFESEFSKRE